MINERIQQLAGVSINEKEKIISDKSRQKERLTRILKANPDYQKMADEIGKMIKKEYPGSKYIMEFITHLVHRGKIGEYEVILNVIHRNMLEDQTLQQNIEKIARKFNKTVKFVTQGMVFGSKYPTAQIGGSYWIEESSRMQQLAGVERVDELFGMRKNSDDAAWQRLRNRIYQVAKREISKFKGYDLSVGKGDSIDVVYNRKVQIPVGVSVDNEDTLFGEIPSPSGDLGYPEYKKDWRADVDAAAKWATNVLKAGVENYQELAKDYPHMLESNEKYLNHPALKPFMDDPYYREVLTARDMTHFSAAVKRLKRARGADAVKQVQAAIRKSGYKISESKEVEFVAFYNKKKIELKATSLWDAKKKAIVQLKVPKSKQGLLAVMNKASYEKGDYRYESVLEAKSDYRIYHSSFTSAADEARELAERLGYEIDEESWFQNVSTGGRYGRGRPAAGKTTKFNVDLTKNGKPQRKTLSFQVYGMESGSYELTAYVA